MSARIAILCTHQHAEDTVYVRCKSSTENVSVDRREPPGGDQFLSRYRDAGFSRTAGGWINGRSIDGRRTSLGPIRSVALLQSRRDMDDFEAPLLALRNANAECREYRAEKRPDEMEL